MSSAYTSLNLPTIEQFIEPDPLTVSPELPLSEAIRLMHPPQPTEPKSASLSSSYALVVEENNIVGIITEADIVRLLASQQDLADVTVGAVMNGPVITRSREECQNLFAVLSYLNRNSLRHLPIVDGGELIGVVTLDSLQRAIQPLVFDRKQSYSNSIVIDITEQKQAQTELERFFAVTPTLFCIAGLDGYFRRINLAFRQILGLSETELLAHPFVNFVHPDDREATVAEVESLAGGKTTLAFENRYRTADGSYRWFLWKATPYIEEQIIYAAAIDITERKQAELALIESEERWQLALRGANDGIWDWNVRTDEVFFSERWKTMLGFRDDEIGSSLEEWSKRVHPDDIGWVSDKIKAHFAQQTPFYISEHRVQCKDGSYKWILDRGQALWDEAGNVLRMTGSHSDITERKQAELELKQERDFTNAILDTVGALVAVINRHGQIVRFNRTCEQITGWSEAEVESRSFWEFLLLDQEKSAVQAVFSKLLAGQVPNQLENHWVSKDGTLHLIAWSNTALFDASGQVEYVVATGIDVTEQRKVQAKLEQQYRQTQIIAEITRKIRVSIELEEILQTSVEEIQNLLVCDRVMIVKQKSSSSVIPIQEAVLPKLPAMLGYELSDPLLLDSNLVDYSRGEVLAIEDINQTEIEPAAQQLLEYFQIRAILIVPILRHNQLEALLVAHQCTCTRAWQSTEIKLLQQLADQIGLALTQAQLLDHLEVLVNQRTTDLIATNQQLLTEIEQHRQTEAALRESQQKLSGILDNASEAIISIDEQQRIQLFNQGAEKIFGYRAGEILGEPLEVLLPEAFRQIYLQHVDNFGRSTHLNRSMNERNREVYGLRKDGSTFPAEASISKLQLREGLLFTVILKDISDRKQAEAAIHRSEAQLRLITNALPSLIAYIDRQQRYQFNNRAHESWFGKTSDQINGSDLKDIFDPIAYNAILPRIEKALSGESVQFELDLSHQGQPRWLSVSFIPDMTEANQIKGFFAMCNDISEQKAVEQIKSEFVSVASHEMRTPLTSIHGVLKLLAAGKLGTLNESGLKMVEIALKNTDRLVRLINDVLDLERMESGRETIQRQSCNTAHLVQQAVETMQPMAEKHQVTLVVHSVAVELWADSDRIIQTLTNLLSNAIKFSPINSQVDLAVQAQKNWVLFSVKDTGRGIPADQLETIFERFKQVDASDSRKRGGTGLGLAICRHIVQQHGGSIWAESIFGQGSTFYFTVPRSIYRGEEG